MSKHDRAKTGGFLDFFGRPKQKGGRPYTTSNGNRPISMDNEMNYDEQEINNEIHGLSVDQVNQKFLEILEDMNIPKDKRQPLIMKTLDEKRDMLKMHLKGNFN